MENILSKEQLENLKSSLPKGFSIIIAKEANCSIPFVYQVFNNTSKNFELTERVLNEALKLKSQYEAKKEKLRQKVASN